MVDVAQSVRVTDCGSEGRGFESHLPPEVNKKQGDVELSTSFCFLAMLHTNLFVGSSGKKQKKLFHQLLA